MDKETQIKSISLVLDNPANTLTTTSRDLLETLRNSIQADIEPEVDKKTEKILRIKEIIREWGATTTAELEADSSPCISSSGTNKMNVSTLVEEFNLSDVKIVTYNNETEIAEDNIPYEDLTEDVIDDILYLLEDYDTDNYKTMQRCQN
jgi:transcription antitermination factor NusA-like protein